MKAKLIYLLTLAILLCVLPVSGLIESIQQIDCQRIDMTEEKLFVTISLPFETIQADSFSVLAEEKEVSHEVLSYPQSGFGNSWIFIVDLSMDVSRRKDVQTTLDSLISSMNSELDNAVVLTTGMNFEKITFSTDKSYLSSQVENFSFRSKSDNLYETIAHAIQTASSDKALKERMVVAVFSDGTHRSDSSMTASKLGSIVAASDATLYMLQFRKKEGGKKNEDYEALSAQSHNGLSLFIRTGKNDIPDAISALTRKEQQFRVITVPITPLVQKDPVKKISINYQDGTQQYRREITFTDQQLAFLSSVAGKNAAPDKLPTGTPAVSPSSAPSSTPSLSPSPSPTDEPKPAPDIMSKYGWVLAVLGVLIIAGCVFAVVKKQQQNQQQLQEQKKRENEEIRNQIEQDKNQINKIINEIQPTEFSIRLTDKNGRHYIGNTVTGSIIIGREEGKDRIVIPDPDKIISRAHAQISLNGNSVMLEDLNSHNGTFIRGKRITSKTLIKPNEIIELGNIPFKVTWNINKSAAPSTDTQ